MSEFTVKAEDYAAPQSAFSRYADMVYRLAFVRTKSRADSDDILQEVFLRYMRVWNKMESEEHIKATIIKITVNQSRTFLSSNWFKKTEPLNETLPSPEQKEDNGVLELVLSLPQKYRTVIHLYYYGGYSVNEIASLTGTKPATVKTHLSRGREMLKKVLKEDYHDL